MDAENNMDIKEFLSNVQPAKKVSRLKKFELEIRELKSKGYTDEQIRQWLAKNGVEVSREAVRRFAKKIETLAVIPPQPPVVKEVVKSDGETKAEKIQRRFAEQKTHAGQTVFKHDKSGNQTD